MCYSEHDGTRGTTKKWVRRCYRCEESLRVSSVEEDEEDEEDKDDDDDDEEEDDEDEHEVEDEMEGSPASKSATRSALTPS